MGAVVSCAPAVPEEDPEDAVRACAARVARGLALSAPRPALDRPAHRRLLGALARAAGDPEPTETEAERSWRDEVMPSAARGGATEWGAVGPCVARYARRLAAACLSASASIASRERLLAFRQAAGLLAAALLDESGALRRVGEIRPGSARTG